MTVAEDLVLIATDPDDGRSLLKSGTAGAVVGGAVLVELVLAERCAIDGPAKRARVQVITTTPTGRTVLDEALRRVRAGREVRASSLVPRLGKNLDDVVRAELVAQGALTATPGKVLGVFPTTRYAVRDTARRDALVAEVRRVLVGEIAPDERTGPLVGLLSAGDVVKRLVPAEQRRDASRRARAIAKGDWAGSAAAAAVAAASAAATAAATAAIAASTAAAAGGA